MATSAPLCAKSSAAARPTPRLPPVTKTERLLKSITLGAGNREPALHQPDDDVRRGQVHQLDAPGILVVDHQGDVGQGAQWAAIAAKERDDRGALETRHLRRRQQ